ncbi:MAG: hypothetical protein WA234_03820 [Rectinemataceae bacterium]
MKNLFRISVFTIIALNLGGTLFGSEPGLLLFLAATAALVSGFPLMSKGFQKAAGVFLTLGIAMLAFSHQPWDRWVEAASSMTNIIAIVAVMQFFTVPIRVGGYDRAIKSWMDGRFRKKSSLFLFMTFTIHILTSFLNLGSLPVTVGLFEATLKARVPDWKRFFARAATRGYVLAALWSPGAVNLYLVVQASGLTWSKVFLPGFILACLGMGVSYLVEVFGTHRNEELKAECRDIEVPVGADAPFGQAPGLEAKAGGGQILHVIAVAGGIVAGSIVGLHPFITIVLFGKILSYIALPIPPITVALALAVGGAAAYMVTPFAGVIMTISRLIDTKAVDVALRWNWRFSILFFAAGLVYAFGWGALFG